MLDAETAIRCKVGPGSAVQCSAVQCSAVQCSAVQCSTVQCIPSQGGGRPGVSKYGAALFAKSPLLWGRGWCSAMQCSAVQCSAVQYYNNGMEWPQGASPDMQSEWQRVLAAPSSVLLPSLSDISVCVQRTFPELMHRTDNVRGQPTDQADPLRGPLHCTALHRTALVETL
jgi:hypothetical protein